MSRTFRRLSAKQHHSRFAKDYTHAAPAVWDGRACNAYGVDQSFPKLPLPGRAFVKAYWKYHTDNGLPSFAFEKAYHRPVMQAEGAQRMQARSQLHRWLKNPDHEVMVLPAKQSWDYP